MEDKRVAILYGILICAVLALGIGVLSLTFSNNDSEKGNEKTTMKVGTKPRRTTTSSDKTDSTDDTTSDVSNSSTTEATSNDSTSPTTENSTSNSTPKVTSKSSTKKTTSKTTKKTTSKTTKKTTTENTTPPSTDRETTNGPTTYPLAQGDIEWAIFDRINQERVKKGFKPVEMAVEFRRLAEEGADYLYDFGDAEVKKYLYGLNNYRRLTNHVLTPEKASLSLYTATVQNTPILTDSSIRYVGIGVIFRQIGLSDLPTYYYVFIYE